MSKERRLGRGLAALLGGFGGESSEPQAVPAPHFAPATPAPAAAGEFAAPRGATPAPVDLSAALSQALPAESTEVGALHIAIADIDTNPFQPRRVFSEPEIASLCESLKAHQMIQPVVVRRIGDRYQLISGERRLRAASKAGWSHVPAHIREADDRLVAEIAIVENLQRQDLNPIEKALSFKRYLDQHRCTQDELAARIKINRSTIANLIRLLELPKPVQTAISEGRLSAGHARALLPLGDEKAQVEFCSRIVAGELSVRQVEFEVQAHIEMQDMDRLLADPPAGQSATREQPAKRPRSEQVAALETELRRALGTKVEIRQSSKGRGKLIIHFASHDDFDRVMEVLTDKPRDRGAA